MRIAIITTGFASEEKETGGAAALHNFVKELTQYPGNDVTVFTMYYPVDKTNYSFFGARVFSFASRGNEKTKTGKLKIWGSLKKKFTAEHNAEKFDIIQALWLGESGYAASQMSKKHNIPLIAACCGGELAAIKSIGYGSGLKFWQKYFVRKTMEQAGVVTAGSGFIMNKLEHVYGGRFYGKAEKIPFGVDEKVFYPAGIKNIDRENIRLVNIANALPVKAHDDLFRAMTIIKEIYPAIQLTCCGSDEKNKLNPLVKKYGLENNVVLKGKTEHSEIPLLLNESDIFVLSSLHESQNVSMIEAAFCGLPVVSARVGVAEEITPYLAEPGDHRSLAEQVIKAITEYNNASGETRNRLTELREKFSLKNSTAKFMNLYERVLS